jgi:hypothetical protein
MYVINVMFSAPDAPARNTAVKKSMYERASLRRVCGILMAADVNVQAPTEWLQCSAGII